MFTSAQPLVLSPSERTDLETMAHSRTLHAALVQRAQLILALADGTAYAALRTRFAVSDPTIARWRQRFVTQRVAGLRDRPRDGREIVWPRPSKRRFSLSPSSRRPCPTPTGLRAGWLRGSA